MTYPIQTHSFINSRTTKPVVLTIAGSDSAGLAGVQMDARVNQALGAHCATAITAATAQNNDQFTALNALSAEQLSGQIDAAMALQPQAIKIGLLASGEQIRCLSEKLSSCDLPVVLDPIIRTSSNGEILTREFIEVLKQTLLPLCTVITPNIPEAEQLSGIKIDSQAQALKAAQVIQTLGPRWVIIKGGHSDDQMATDLCLGPDAWFELSLPKIATEHLRGTGCAFASLLAASIALGYDIRDGLVIAKMAMQQGVINGQSVNQQRGALQVTGFPKSYWPSYNGAELSAHNFSQPFASCVARGEPTKLGLYPVVDSAAWLARLLPLGVTTAQLRVKNLQGKALEQEIETAITLGKQYNCRVFINDYWQIAIEKGAYGVHLGQEDILTADFSAIRTAGLRLGLSTHCHYEVVRARAIKPSYIACGPTYATTTKDMPWVPHGVEGLSYWCNSINDYPLVCIGGINQARFANVATTGVSGVAMITAITQAEFPELVAKDLLQSLNNPSLKG